MPRSPGRQRAGLRPALERPAAFLLPRPSPSQLEAGGRLYFVASNAAGARKLFVHDGAAGTLDQVCDLRGDPSLSDAPCNLVEADGRLYFDGQVADGVRKLFCLDLADDALVHPIRVDHQEGSVLT